jgi:hypothetical protein
MSDDDDVEPRLTTKVPPWLGLVLAGIASFALVAACFSHRWLTNPYLGDMGFSPLSLKACNDGDCESASLFELVDKSREAYFDEARVSMAFPVGGMVAFVSLLLAVVGLLGAAGFALAKKPSTLPISPATVAILGIMFGMIAGCVFVATKPGGTGGVGVGWSFWAFGIGCVAGIVAAQLLAKQIRPPDPDLLHDAMNPDQF